MSQESQKSSNGLEMKEIAPGVSVGIVIFEAEEGLPRAVFEVQTTGQPVSADVIKKALLLMDDAWFDHWQRARVSDAQRRRDEATRELDALQRQSAGADA